MRRCLMILPSLIALAACADGPPPASGPQQGDERAFRRGGVAGVIVIDTLDNLPLRAAELVAPDGAATPATSLDVDANPRRSADKSTLGDPWRSSDARRRVGNARCRPRTFYTGAALAASDAVADGLDRRHRAARPGRLSPRLGPRTIEIRLTFGAAGRARDARNPAAAPPAAFATP